MYDEFLEEGIRDLPKKEKEAFHKLLKAYYEADESVQCERCGALCYLVPIFRDGNPENIGPSNTYFLCLGCVAALNKKEALYDFMFRGF